MRELMNCYFKDNGTHTVYMSGLPIPCDPADNVCRCVHFTACDFHPACRNIKFEDCIFQMCTFSECFDDYQMDGCQIIHKCDWCDNVASKKLEDWTEREDGSEYKLTFRVCRMHANRVSTQDKLTDF